MRSHPLASGDKWTPEQLWAAGWGLDPAKRRNRLTVRLLLTLTPPRRLPHPSLQRLRVKAQRAVSTLVGCDFRAKTFGSDLFLPHPFGIVVHAKAVIGNRVTLMQGVTLGENQRVPGVPIVGDDVTIGAGAVVLGPVTIGDRAVIGAGSVVVGDVAPGTTVVGNPARPI